MIDNRGKSRDSGQREKQEKWRVPNSIGFMDHLNLDPPPPPGRTLMVSPPSCYHPPISSATYIKSTSLPGQPVSLEMVGLANGNI